MSLQWFARSCQPAYHVPVMAATDRPSELDIHRVSSAYLQAVETARPEHLELPRRLLQRLDPDRWRLEWCLPWWLGRAFGLDVEIADELVLSNVLGLGAIRLRDDLVDGEVAADEIYRRDFAE